MSETYQHIYVSAGDFNSPYFDFYTDASGTQELTPTNTLYLDTSYIFHRVDNDTTHPFYISDVSYEEPNSTNISLSGDGSYNSGITSSETLTLEFTGLDTSDNLYYYCTNHSSMVNTFTLVETTPEVDTTAPTLSSIIPLLDASNVAIDSSFTFVFSENVNDVSNNNITIYDASNSVVEIIDISSVNVSIVDNQVVVNPTNDLSYNTSYYVNIDAGAFVDDAGNEFTGLDSSSNSGMRFTTEEEPDIISPTLVSFSPTLNAVDVSANTELVFNFDENIFVSGSGNVTIYDASNNLVVQEIDMISVSISGEIMTVNLLNDLSYNNEYYVNIDADVLADDANNFFTGLDSSSNSGMRFTTQLDTFGPTIESITPFLEETNVSISNNLIFTFNENITDGSGNITIYDDSNNTIVEVIDISSDLVTISGSQLTVDPSFDLSYSTTYYVNIDAGTLQDSVGNEFAGLDSSSNSGMRFTTEDEPDIIAPTLVSFSPTLNAVDVSANTELVFTFDENIFVSGIGNVTIYDASSNLVVQEIDIFSENTTISGEIMTVGLLNDLSYNNEYYVNIDADVLADNANNFFTGLDSSSNTGMRFTTEIDVYPPEIISFSPALDSTDNLIDTDLVFTFNEELIVTSGNITLYDASSNVALQVFDVSSSDVSITGREVTVTLQTDLSFDTSYYVNIDANTFEDSLGNSFTGLDSSSNSGMRFTTASDYIGPVLTDVSPLLNAIDISVNSALEFTFDEDISGGTGSITIFDASLASDVQTISLPNSNVDISGNHAVVNLTTDLPYGKDLYVNITTGTFIDVFGNDFTGLNSSAENTGMRFTTEPDVVAPTLVSISPLLNATDISINSNLVFTFSENMFDGSGNVYIYDSSTNDLLNTFNISSSNVSITGSQVTINPTVDLSFNRSLYVNIDSGALEDEAGNIYTGLDSSGSNTGMRFTTERDVTIPTITKISPILNAVDVAINTNLRFTFSEEIVQGSGGIFLYQIDDDALVRSFDVSSSEVSISGNQVVIVNPSDDLSYNTGFYVNIDAGAFQDLRGNEFTGLVSSSIDTGMRFTTELDTVLPTITSISPVLNATDISVNTNLEFNFSEEIVPVNGNITIYRSSNNIILQVIDVTSDNVTISGTHVIVNPDRDLPYDLSFYVNIDAGAFQDLRGNDFNGLVSSSTNTGMRFTTEQSIGDPDVISPTLTKISPSLDEEDVRIDTLLVFTFSEQPILDVTGSITIYNAMDNTVIQTVDVTGPHVTITGTQVVVKPPIYLPVNTAIYVNIGSNALLDSAGNNFAGLDSSISGNGMRFTTIDPTKTRLFDIIRFCQDKKCQQNIRYNQLKTGGNDPSMSSAMRYAQYVRSAKPRKNQLF